MDWTEIVIEIPAEFMDEAADIANMAVPYGIYIEDYRHLEEEAREIANIDLIDEALLQKDRTKGLVHLYMPKTENPTEAVSFLRERYRAAGIPNEIRTAVCKNEDWENNWKAYFKPMLIGKKLRIQPAWIPLDENAEHRAVLNIEPGLAFGTGGHDTTRLCLETLENYITPDCSVLDTGCGSGILSIAALLLGAGSAVGVDIDELAVKTARENGTKNGFTEPQYKVLEGNLADRVSGKFDVVVANIVADIVMRFAKQVGAFMKPDAVFISSGIIDSRADEVAAALVQNGFVLRERREQNGWACFVCTLQQK